VQDQFTKAIVAAVTPTLSGQPSGSLLADARRGTTDQEA
jgi:hypothetical protein